MKKYIPSTITLLNLTCGFIAIILNDILWSPILIAIGALLDLFDGLAARLLNAVSDLGKQLDSLADLITFGVAPAILYYQHILPHNYLGIISASFIPAFGAYRLAKFNISTDQKEYFKGLPIPANGIFFLSIPFLINFNNYSWFLRIVQIDFVNLLFPVIFGLLMASNIKMFSFKKIKGIINIQTFYILSVIVLVAIFQWVAVPLSIILFVIYSIIDRILLKDSA
ncbi:CDP-diacylglycerol--serine O-phosphatidyltransferase [Bacteroidota bacterium]